MGQYLFRLPDVGEGVAEAEIVAWHVAVGDLIAEDQSLVDVMTDKATVDMTSPVDGVVIAIHGAVGTMMPVGSVLVELEVEGVTESEAAPVATIAPTAASAVALVPERTAVAGTSLPPLPAEPATTPLAAPATRRRARDLRIDLAEVRGTGPKGRIVPDDLDAFAERRKEAPIRGEKLEARTGVDSKPVIGLRRRIAERMQESKRRIPHFGYVEECDLTELEALRQHLNASRSERLPKLTLLPFLIRALVRILPEFPEVNARYDDDAGVLDIHEAVHVGIATQTPGGLMVPVVRHAEALDLWDCAAELGRVTGAAREGRATREQLSGSTITLTSLGALGGIAATPVINHPEVAIIGPNKLVDRPIVRDGQVTIRKMMNLSSSFDHRIVDGFVAASFIQRLKQMIEHPALIFMDRP